MNTHYSVLMSVYSKENPRFLREALESVFHQTVVTDNLVLVCDGPITQELQAVIDDFLTRYPTIFRVFQLPENRGLGHALNYGLRHCKHELVGRMDTDDICKNERFEKQLQQFHQNDNLVLSSGAIEEFLEDPSVIRGRRSVPQEYQEILSFSKRRNPFNHPAVMFKKSVVEAVGGYDETYPLFEDYYLWVRILKAGYYASNVDEVLVLMRTPADLYQRRGGMRYAKDLLRFNQWMFKVKWIGLSDYLFSSIPHAIVCLVPNGLRKMIYEKLHS
ncbi:glycosyltransferase [Streptococcus pneumoniae]